jgi:hypothetical protein
MTISIDFDGTIMKREGIPTAKGDWLDNEPMPGALESINLFIDLGHQVIISTSNRDIERIKAWLEKNNFPEIKVTNEKVICHIHIDDRALRFTNWQDIRKYIA